jgi:hypothetical protein
MSDFDEDESPKVSLASITCIRQNCKEDDKVTIQEEEVQPPTTRYIPPHLRNSGTIRNSQDKKPMISLAAITGKVEPRTLKFKGRIKGKNITILVDSGSTHNFVDINLARQLNLFVYPVRNLVVTTTDGQQIKGLGRCHKVSVQIQNLELQSGYYALPLSGMDMVLGAEWLMQLGTYATNLQEQFMEFKWQGKNYKVYGSESLHHPQKELTSIQKQIQNQDASPQWKKNSSKIALRTKHTLIK